MASDPCTYCLFGNNFSSLHPYGIWHVYAISNQSFDDTLNNDIVSFEQLGPGYEVVCLQSICEKYRFTLASEATQSDKGLCHTSIYNLQCYTVSGSGQRKRCSSWSGPSLPAYVSKTHFHILWSKYSTIFMSPIPLEVKRDRLFTLRTPLAWQFLVCTIPRNDWQIFIRIIDLDLIFKVRQDG